MQNHIHKGTIVAALLLLFGTSAKAQPEKPLLAGVIYEIEAVDGKVSFEILERGAMSLESAGGRVKSVAVKLLGGKGETLTLVENPDRKDNVMTHPYFGVMTHPYFGNSAKTVFVKIIDSKEEPDQFADSDTRHRRAVVVVFDSRIYESEEDIDRAKN